MKKENNCFNKIYKDEIIEFNDISDWDTLHLFDYLKKDDNKIKQYYLDYVSSDILKNYDLSEKEDVNRFQNILYKCDSPILSMVSYDGKSDTVKLVDPQKRINGCFLFHQGKLIYTTMKDIFENNFKNKSNNHYITTMDYFYILKILIENSSNFYVYSFNDLSLKEVNIDFLEKILDIDLENNDYQKIKK